MQAEGQDRVITIGPLRIDRAGRTAFIDDSPVRLSRTEFELLCMLGSDPHRVFPKRELLDQIWGDRASVKPRTLDSHASRLRRKLGTGYVVNCWGVGYRLLGA